MPSYLFLNPASLRCECFSAKNIERKHLCRHDKNYYYFCKSNIPVINLVLGSCNMIKVSGKNVSFLKFVGEIQQLPRKRSYKNN